MQDCSELVEFQEKFRVKEFSLTEYKYWELSLRPQQLTLGSMVLSVKDNWQSFSELSREAVAEMGLGFTQAERAVKEVFGAVRINILCLMMQDPIVHFHIIPRYNSDKKFSGTTWRDEDWPSPPRIRPVEVDEPALQSLLKSLSMAHDLNTVNVSTPSGKRKNR